MADLPGDPFNPLKATVKPNGNGHGHSNGMSAAPSLTDTFGVVQLEALACGTPVAAFPVAGPRDIVTDKVGALSDDLDRAIAAALFCDRADCAALGARYSWESATDQFLAGLAALDSEGLPAWPTP